MKKLNYQTLHELGYDGYLLKDAPERVVQFGEGNFLRAFADYFIDKMNETVGFHSKVAVIQPSSRPSSGSAAQRLNEQEGLYTLYLRGIENGVKTEEKRIISCISRCLNMYSDYQEVMALAGNPDLRFLICNTTEAGIAYDPSCLFSETPPSSYPAKLTQFLYRRYQQLHGRPGSGLILLPCELIENNGDALRRCVLDYASLWELPADFSRWIRLENRFCSTLVDRIVTGYPASEASRLNAENGYEDRLIDTGEIFASWVIEGDETLEREFPAGKAGLPVLITRDHKPYKERKVRILNGAHTSMVPGAFLAGKDIVRDCMHDGTIRSFMNRTIREEIIPTLSLPAGDCLSFADAVIERFENPYIDHALLSILLNTVSKWRARVLPSLCGYAKKTGVLPERLTASFAFCLAFYRTIQKSGSGFFGLRGDGTQYPVSDSPKVLSFFLDHRNDTPEALVHAVCARTDFWGMDLTELPGFEDAALALLKETLEKGSFAVMKRLA